MKIYISPKYQDDNVLDILRRQNIYLSADCGGRGTCGKCRVRLSDPASCTCPTDEERRLISEKDLEKGVRLACQTCISDAVQIEIPKESFIQEGSPSKLDVQKIDPLSPSEVIAVDYGTTMISGALVDLNKGVIREASLVNHQKAYGADVISRIRAVNDGYGEELRAISMEDLAGLSELLGRDPERARYVISGNTVMEHILSGYSCKGLGEYPYTPVDISLRRDGDMTFLPGISAFVGADIVSGICACSLDKAKTPWLYVDIGTNGEMALGTGSRILTASAPAGPAFEGGGLSSGMPALGGAIYSCEIAGTRTITRTVAGAKPLGICGSGVIDITAELLRNRIIDKSGKLADEFSEEGFPVAGDVVITQSDIREVQKAKGAIRAGIEMLLRESGLKVGDVEKLVIAGSFGSGIDTENASRIGLIPEELAGACATAGNASLAGATLYPLDTGFSARLSHVAETAETIELSEMPGFSYRYVSDMEF